MACQKAGVVVWIRCCELKKILVTGANGWIGQATVVSLRSSGYEVRGASRTAMAGDTVVVRDFREQMVWGSELAGIDCVVHLAAVTRAGGKDDAASLRAIRQINVDATLQLARESVEQGVRRFVFLSSVKVNGERAGVECPFSSDGQPHPEDSYSMTKLEAERGLMEIACSSNLEVVIIRPPLVYGPAVKGNFAALVGVVKRGFPLPFKGVNNRRSMIALDNLTDLIVRCVDREKTPQAANEIFLASDGRDVSLPELLCLVAAAYGKSVRLFSVPEKWLRMLARVFGKTAAASRLLDSLAVNIEKTESLLGWQPVVTMEQQLEKMAKKNAENV